jgi:hypothetical protein
MLARGAACKQQRIQTLLDHLFVVMTGVSVANRQGELKFPYYIKKYLIYEFDVA